MDNLTLKSTGLDSRMKLSLWQQIYLLLPSLTICLILMIASIEASFFTFYLPNTAKATGRSDLKVMIDRVERRINEMKDNFADLQWFWGQMQKLDEIPADQRYPENSVCEEIFPAFRDLAIEYMYIDFHHSIQPLEKFLDHLNETREKWFPKVEKGDKGKFALPKKWEFHLLERELELEIHWLSQLVDSEDYKAKRNRMLDLWKNVRRGLDTSLSCLYLKMGFHQISRDLNEMALEGNLQGLRAALAALQDSYPRIERFYESDAKLIADIERAAKERQKKLLAAGQPTDHEEANSNGKQKS